MTPAHDPPSRLWPYLLAYAAAAVWIDFTAVHRLHMADSVVPTLASLYEWRPFFWGQDRVGMLWSLLFSWCHHPLGNLLLQTGTTSFLGLCTPLLFVRLLTPHRAGPVVATAFSAGLLALGSPGVQLSWLLVCYYPSALALALTGLLLLDGRDRTRAVTWQQAVVAWALLLASHWLYVGVVVFLAPLVVFRAWAATPVGRPVRQRLAHAARDPHTRLAVGGVAFAFLTVFALMRWAQGHDPSVLVTPTVQLPPAVWPTVYAGLFREAAVQVGLPLVLAVAAVVVVGLARRLHSKAAEPAVAAGPVLLAAVTEFLFLGSCYWVWENKCSPRYLVAGLTAVAAAAVSIGWVPVVARLGRGRWAAGVTVVLLFVGATVQFGWPGWDEPRRAVAEASGDYAGELVAAEVDGVGGEYWRVWPAVYQLNLARADRGDPEVAWGLTYRSGPWAHRWANEPGKVLRVGVLSDGDEESAARGLRDADEYGEAYGLTRVGGAVGRVGRVTVYEYRAGK